MLLKLKEELEYRKDEAKRFGHVLSENFLSPFEARVLHDSIWIPSIAYILPQWDPCLLTLRTLFSEA